MRVINNRTGSLTIVIGYISSKDESEDYDEFLFWMGQLNILLCCDSFLFNGSEVFANKLPERNTISFYNKDLELRSKISFDKHIVGMSVEVDQVSNMMQIIKESIKEI